MISSLNNHLPSNLNWLNSLEQSSDMERTLNPSLSSSQLGARVAHLNISNASFKSKGRPQRPYMQHSVRESFSVSRARSKSDSILGIRANPTPLATKLNPVETTSVPKISDSLQQQGRLLLVALLENFCSLYHKEPEKNRQLFLVLCRRLCNMGVLQSVDFVDETTHIRAVYKRAFHELVAEAIRTITPQSTISPHNAPQLIAASSVVNELLETLTTGSSVNDSFDEFLSRELSRYAEDFIELDILGKGGFGKVFKVQNRVDKRIYAIKMIQFSSIYSPRFQRIMREVRAMANLDHPNVIRYHSAWIEEGTACATGLQATTSLNDKIPLTCSNTGGLFESEQVDSLDSNLFDSSRLTNRLTMYIQMELCNYTLHDWLDWRNRYFFGEPVGANCPVQLNTLVKQLPTLFSKSKHWDGCRERVEIDYVSTIRVFKNIVKGLAHIHAQGLIHRDLKPQNIFFGCEDAIPKIGDFGLVSAISYNESMPLSSSNPEGIEFQTIPINSISSTSNLPRDMEKEDGMALTSGLGTELYASPEQMSGVAYNYKTDIYSLGIICFELFHPFKTQMERCRLLTDLKNHKRFPSEFLRKYPKETAFIWSCLSADPDKRPTAMEILELELLLKHDQAEERYDELLESYEVVMAALLTERNENERLRGEADRQADELERLKQRMEKLESFIQDLAEPQEID